MGSLSPFKRRCPWPTMAVKILRRLMRTNERYSNEVIVARFFAATPPKPNSLLTCHHGSGTNSLTSGPPPNDLSGFPEPGSRPSLSPRNRLHAGTTVVMRGGIKRSRNGCVRCKEKKVLEKSSPSCYPNAHFPTFGYS